MFKLDALDLITTATERELTLFVAIGIVRLVREFNVDVHKFIDFGN